MRSRAIGAPGPAARGRTRTRGGGRPAGRATRHGRPAEQPLHARAHDPRLPPPRAPVQVEEVAEPRLDGRRPLEARRARLGALALQPAELPPQLVPVLAAEAGAGRRPPRRPARRGPPRAGPTRRARRRAPRAAPPTPPPRDRPGR